jgi:hypothetical protein
VIRSASFVAILCVASLCATSACRRGDPVRTTTTTTNPPPAPRTTSAVAEPVTTTSHAVGESHDENSDDAQAAVAILHDYYAAISAHDYERAYRSWGASGPPGQTLPSFTAGFADTASVEAKTGTPSRIEPAAGSRYIEVPVTILTTTKAGHAQHFNGTYTLRRTVVDGAPASERKWHLYRASIREATGENGIHK